MYFTKCWFGKAVAAFSALSFIVQTGLNGPGFSPQNLSLPYLGGPEFVPCKRFNGSKHSLVKNKWFGSMLDAVNARAIGPNSRCLSWS